MKVNPVSLVFILALVYPIVKGFLFKYSSSDIKRDIMDLCSNISLVISLFFGVIFSKKVFLEHEEGVYKTIYEAIPYEITSFIDGHNLVYYAVVIPVSIYVVYKVLDVIFNLINRFTLYPFADGVERVLEDKSSFFKRVAGAVFQVPKAVIYVLFFAFLLNILSMFNILGEYNKYLEGSKTYNYLCREVVIPVTNSSLAKQLPTILDNSFKVVVQDAEEDKAAPANSKSVINQNKRRVIIYYNGVTLEEAVESNSSIDTFAVKLASKGSSYDKAKTLYKWIGENIDYDYDKANKVLRNDFSTKSGAVEAFETKKGICFDYSSLYVAMARANGLKVRIITGEGFNGVSWVSHAWNQVYIPEQDKWINVDTTFYQGGNYFDTKRFSADHREAKVAGEW
jgi:hypothetical protein